MSNTDLSNQSNNTSTILNTSQLSDTSYTSSASVSSDISSYSPKLSFFHFTAEQISKRKKIVEYPLFSCKWISPSPKQIKLYPDITHHGYILFGGGGGRAGTGVDSGLLICKVTSDKTNNLTKPVNPKSLHISEESFLNSHDELIVSIALSNSSSNNLSLSIGGGSVKCKLEYETNNNKLNIQTLEYVQTDYSIDLCAQSQTISMDETLLATGGEDGVVRIYDFLTMEYIAKCVANNDNNSNNLVSAFTHKDMILSLDFNADVNYLASVAGDETIKIWDITTIHNDHGIANLVTEIKVNEFQNEKQHFQAIRFIGGTPEYINRPVYHSSPATLHRRKLSAPDEKNSNDENSEDSDNDYNNSLTSSSNPIRSTSPFGEPEYLLAIVNIGKRRSDKQNNRLIKINTYNWSIMQSIQVSTKSLIQMEVSNNQQYIVVSDSDNSIFIYSIQTFQLISSHLQCHDLPCTSLCFSPNNNFVLSVSADRTFKLIPVQKKKQKSKTIQFFNFLSLFIVLLAILISLLFSLFEYNIINPHDIHPSVVDSYHLLRNIDWKQQKRNLKIFQLNITNQTIQTSKQLIQFLHESKHTLRPHVINCLQYAHQYYLSLLDCIHNLQYHPVVIHYLDSFHQYINQTIYK